MRRVASVARRSGLPALVVASACHRAHDALDLTLAAQGMHAARTAGKVRTIGDPFLIAGFTDRYRSG